MNALVLFFAIPITVAATSTRRVHEAQQQMVLGTTQTNHHQNRNQHGSKPKTNENGEETVKSNRT